MDSCFAETGGEVVVADTLPVFFNRKWVDNYFRFVYKADPVERIRSMNRSANNSPVYPSPSQGVGKAGRSRRTRNAEIASSNLAALTIITTSPTTQR